jgi:hypothetical protein
MHSLSHFAERTCHFLSYSLASRIGLVHLGGKDIGIEISMVHCTVDGLHFLNNTAMLSGIDAQALAWTCGPGWGLARCWSGEKPEGGVFLISGLFLCRRLTTGRSGEIITRLGSGQMMSMPSIPFQSPRGQHDPKLPLPELRRSSAGSCSSDGPKEPKDGTLAQPGPSHAKIAGRLSNLS